MLRAFSVSRLCYHLTKSNENSLWRLSANCKFGQGIGGRNSCTSFSTVCLYGGNSNQKVVPRVPDLVQDHCSKVKYYCTNTPEVKETKSLTPQDLIDKYDLPTKKKKFERRKPFDYSGDMVEQQPMDSKETMFLYEGVADKIELPEDVEKTTTIGFADGQEKQAHRIWKTQQKFFNIGKGSDKEELLVLRQTVRIRNLLAHLSKHKKDKLAKIIVQHQIQARQKLLKRFRKMDYKRFDWLLRELQIRYKPHPTYLQVGSRRAVMRAKLRNQAIQSVRDKINEAYQKLDDEKERFYAEKEATLERIRQDLIKYDIPDHVVLDNVKKLRQERIEERKEKRVPAPNTFKYIFYDKEQVVKKRADKRKKKAQYLSKVLDRDKSVKSERQKVAEKLREATLELRKLGVMHELEGEEKYLDDGSYRSLKLVKKTVVKASERGLKSWMKERLKSETSDLNNEKR